MRRKSFSETVGDVEGETLENTLHHGLAEMEAANQTTHCAISRVRHWATR